MFKLQSAADHVLAMQFSGKLSADDARQAQQAMDAKLGRHAHLGVVIDIGGLSDLEAGALAAGMKADLDFLQHIGQFQRMAFVSDKEWPAAMLGVIKPLLAGLEMKAYKSAQHEEALQWAGQQPAESGSKHRPGMRLVPTTSENVLAFEIDGPLTAASVGEIFEQVKRYFDTHGKVNLLAHIKHLGGIDPSLFMQSGLLSMKLAALDKVERYAIVGAPGWMNAAVKALDPVMTDIELRTFAEEDQEAAWKWVCSART